MEEEKRGQETKLNADRRVGTAVECSFRITEGGGHLLKGEGVWLPDCCRAVGPEKLTFKKWL